MKGPLLNNLIETQMRSYASMLSSLANVECEAKAGRQKKGMFRFYWTFPTTRRRLYIFSQDIYDGTGYNIPQFLDCGCGYGNIMLLAYSLGCSTYGIDLNERALKLARLNNNRNDLMSGGKHWRVYCRDILTYKDYGKYDIIYYYCPMKDKKLERKFETRLADEMRVGAIVLPFYSTQTFREDNRFVHLSDITGFDKYRRSLILSKTEE